MSFTTIPNIPQQSELTEWEARFMGAIKQNVELLTGQRADGRFAAFLVGSLDINAMGPMSLQQITAVGAGVTISGSDVPLLDDYTKLILDVIALANDVAEMRNTLNALIAQINAA